MRTLKVSKEEAKKNIIAVLDKKNKRRREVMRYEEAKDIFENTRRRKLDNNTYLTKTEEGYGIRLHNTVVVELLKDRVRLNSGGWKTITTKDRINQYSPVRIFQKGGVWYLGEEESPFFEGVEISYNGAILNANKSKNEKILKKQQSILKKIDTYVKGFMKKIEAGELPAPSGGDCWCCSMKNEKGICLGDLSDNNQHLLDHMKERYYVPSLLVNAIKEKGYNPSFINPWGGLGGSRDTYSRSLRDFLKKRLLKGEA